jgi:hypothetical protein
LVSRRPPRTSTALFEMRVLPRNGITLQHDLIVGAAPDANARPFEHEALTEKIRLLRIDDYKAIVTQPPGSSSSFPDDLGDSRPSNRRHESELDSEKV